MIRTAFLYFKVRDAVAEVWASWEAFKRHLRKSLRIAEADDDE